MTMSRKGRSTAAIAVSGIGFGVALGAVLGTFVLVPAQGGRIDSAQGTAGSEHTASTRAVEEAQAQADAADAYAGVVAGRVVSDRLSARPVLIIQTASADQKAVDAVAGTLTDAGAINAGVITVDAAFFSAEGADSLRTIASKSLPAGATLSPDALDSGTHAGELLGAALLLDPATAEPLAATDERATVLRSLRDANLIHYADGTILPAQAVIIVDGDASTSDSMVAQNEASFAEAIKAKGGAAVLAAPPAAAGEQGAIGVLRKKNAEVSTVDALDKTWGRTVAVLALIEQISGGHGAYGVADNAVSVAPGGPMKQVAAPASEPVPSTSAAAPSSESATSTEKVPR